MIEVQSLLRLYGRTTAVANVSFRIASNEVVGLLGHNGAGKTTIMKMLSGYLEPSAGSIRIDGLDMASDSRTIQQYLGYLPENLPVYPEMMVADFLDYAATLKGIPRAERGAAIRDAIAATDLAQRALDPIGVLSRGLKQRVGVAQAILGSPRLLILDEPTNGLDPEQTDHMRALIKRLAQRATVILSTHIMQEVEAVCDRVLMLRQGKLALDESLATLHHSDAMVLCTGGDPGPLQEYLQSLPQVTAVVGGGGEYRIQLQPTADHCTAANDIAHCVMRSGAQLHQLHPLTRDLDSVFRDTANAGDDADE